MESLIAHFEKIIDMNGNDFFNLFRTTTVCISIFSLVLSAFFSIRTTDLPGGCVAVTVWFTFISHQRDIAG